MEQSTPFSVITKNIKGRLVISLQLHLQVPRAKMRVSELQRVPYPHIEKKTTLLVYHKVFQY